MKQKSIFVDIFFDDKSNLELHFKICHHEDAIFYFICKTSFLTKEIQFNFY